MLPKRSIGQVEPHVRHAGCVHPRDLALLLPRRFQRTHRRIPAAMLAGEAPRVHPVPGHVLTWFLWDRWNRTTGHPFVVPHRLTERAAPCPPPSASVTRPSKDSFKGKFETRTQWGDATYRTLGRQALPSQASRRRLQAATMCVRCLPPPPTLCHELIECWQIRLADTSRLDR